MGYKRQNFKKGQVLTAGAMNSIDVWLEYICGREITAAAIVNGELVFTFKNGDTFNAGKVTNGEGTAGNGISEIVMNDDYTLTFEFADGTSYTTPPLRGNDGKGGKSVTDYGAKGDGTTDDTAAFEVALAANRIVFVPSGTYKLSRTLMIRANCCLELCQDTMLNFTQTTGNCIDMRSSSALRGNHAIINVPFEFDGHVINATSTNDTATGVVPYTGWTPMWKHSRYIYDICIVKANGHGTHISENGKDCCGTGIYLSGDGNNEVRFIWGALLKGVRIGGAFARGIHAINFDLSGKEDSAWNHDMRIEAVIHGCEIGVDLTNCNDVHLAVAVQPAVAYNETPYAKWGVYLNDCRYIDMSSSVIWDWNDKNSLYTPGGQYTTVAMFGNCCGLVYYDFGYHTNSTRTRDRIYTDTPSNLKKMTIVQEPIDAVFKVIDGVPYFANGSINEKLISDNDLSNYFKTDYVKEFVDVLPTATGTDGSIYNGVGYKKGVYVTANNGTEGTSSYYTTTGFIPCKNGDKVYVKDMSMASDNAGYARIVLYNASKGYITVVNRDPNLINNSSSFCQYEETDNGCVFTIGTGAAISGVAFVRITFNNSCVGDAPMVAINQEIKYTVAGFLADGVKVKAVNVIGDIATGNGIPYIEGNSTTAGTWTGTCESITEYYDGLTILYKLNVAGASGGTTLDINGLGAVAVNRNASTAVTTIYPAGTVLLLTYSGGKWLTADYDANSKNTAGTSAKNDTQLYLVGATSKTSSGTTTYVNDNVYIGADNELYSNGKKVVTEGNIPSGGGLEPLIGTTDEITPKQVAEAVAEGRAVAITHTDDELGVPITFDSFALVQEMQISGTCHLPEVLVNEGEGLVHTVNLVGSLPDNVWISVFINDEGGGGSSGADIDVTAEVGQTIVVKEVDENGKPTKWESADYQPRTHWTEVVQGDLVPHTEFTPVYNETFQMLLYGLPTFDLEAGKTYTVVFDGVEYTSTAKAGTIAQMMDAPFVSVGNTALHGVQSEEPFFVAQIPVFSTFAVVCFTAGPHTIQIIGEKTVHHKIPEEYLSKSDFMIELGFIDGTSFSVNTPWDDVAAAVEARKNIYAVVLGGSVSSDGSSTKTTSILQFTHACIASEGSYDDSYLWFMYFEFGETFFKTIKFLKITRTPDGEISATLKASE